MTQDNKLSQSEALYGFMAYLTGRSDALTIGADAICSPIPALIDQFCKANNLDDPSGDYHNKLALMDSSLDNDQLSALTFISITPEVALGILKRAFANDLYYAYSWHCNIAMAIMDSFPIGASFSEEPHTFSNKAASAIMKSVFDVDTHYDMLKGLSGHYPDHPIEEKSGDESLLIKSYDDYCDQLVTDYSSGDGETNMEILNPPLLPSPFPPDQESHTVKFYIDNGQLFRKPNTDSSLLAESPPNKSEEVVEDVCGDEVFHIGKIWKEWLEDENSIIHKDSFNSISHVNLRQLNWRLALDRYPEDFSVKENSETSS